MNVRDLQPTEENSSGNTNGTLVNNERHDIYWIKRSALPPLFIKCPFALLARFCTFILFLYLPMKKVSSLVALSHCVSTFPSSHLQIHDFVHFYNVQSHKVLFIISLQNLSFFFFFPKLKIYFSCFYYSLLLVFFDLSLLLFIFFNLSSLFLFFIFCLFFVYFFLGFFNASSLSYPTKISNFYDTLLYTSKQASLFLFCHALVKAFVRPNENNQTTPFFPFFFFFFFVSFFFFLMYQRKWKMCSSAISIIHIKLNNVSFLS